jgi:hypothetical protein
MSNYNNGGIIGVDITYDDYEPYVIGQITTATRLRPTYVGGRTQAITGTTSDVTFSLTGLTGGLATAPVQGDFVIVAFMAASITAGKTLSTSSSGWTQITQLYSADTTYDVYLTAFYKIMGASPDTSITFAGGTGAAADAGAAVCHVWRGVDTTTPLDVTSTTATGIDTRNANPPAITPTTTNSLIIAIGACGYSGSNDTYDNGPTNFTQFLTAQASGTNDGNIGIAAFRGWTSGSIDPSAFVNGTSSTDTGWAAYTLALRPKLTDVITPQYGAQKNSGIWNLQGQYESRLSATITVVNSSWNNTEDATASSIGVVAPRNVRPGDLIIAFAGNSDSTGTAQFNDTTLKPTGFTLIKQISTATADASCAAWYKYADGSEGETTITIPAQSTQYMWGAIVIVRNAKSTDPIDVTGTNLDVGSATIHEVPAVTTTINKCLAFFVLSSDGSDVLPFAFYGTGWSSERTVTAYDLTDLTNVSVDGVAGMIGWKYIPTAGTTEKVEIAFAGAGGADGASGFMFAVDGVL